jgi:RNA polymerase sigma-70 factor, ECF subfamily
MPRVASGGSKGVSLARNQNKKFCAMNASDYEEIVQPALAPSLYMLPVCINVASQESFDSATDEQLLNRYREAGDVPAFETLVHRYERPLLRYLLHYLHNEALAEDVLQATLLRLHQKCSSFDQDRFVRPWLYSIATHLAVDALRSAARHHTSSLDAMHAVDDDDERALRDLLRLTSPSPLEELELRERAEWIRKEVNKLPEPLRVLILLIYFQGLKFHEVAEVLHLPLGTVKTRVHKALAALNEACRRDHCGL